MGKRLVLTEKPSVAADFAAGVGGMQKKKGYFEGKGTVVTYCFGHLLELFYPEDYEGRLKTWSLDDLPIVPQRFRYKPVSSSKDQLQTIKGLLSDREIDEVILATDAGREGELIGRLVLNYCGWKDWNAVRRFWVSEALTPPVVQKGLADLRDSSRYMPLFEAGKYRQQSDWLVGINFSRLYSIRLAGRFSFGRVQTAVLGLIVRRDREIADFKPVAYWEVHAKLDKSGAQFVAKVVRNETLRFDERATAEAVVDEVQSSGEAVVVDVKREEKQSKPPKLLNLTALQRLANTRFGFSADKTLKIAQKLYEERKILSYPRTPSRVLGGSDTALVRDLSASLSTAYPDLFERFQDELVSEENKRVFNDAQLEDHHALMPLAPAPADLSEDEKAIYDTVLISFVQAFWPDERFVAVKLTMRAGRETLVAGGRTVIDPGWRAIGGVDPDAAEKGDDEEDESASLPDVSVNDSLRVVEVVPVGKETKPPAAFTEASLLAAMERPGRFAEDKEGTKFEAGVGLGTQATRAEIIETLLKREYVSRAKRKLLATEKGFHFYDAVVSNEDMARFLEVDETARWEKLLHDRPVAFFEDVTSFVQSAMDRLRGESLTAFRKEKEVIGKCPKCGSAVHESKKNFYCSRWKETGCDFTIWKSFVGATISKAAAAKLLEGKESGRMKFTSKAGNKFEGKLTLNGHHKLELIFSDSKQTGGVR